MVGFIFGIIILVIAIIAFIIGIRYRKRSKQDNAKTIDNGYGTRKEIDPSNSYWGVSIVGYSVGALAFIGAAILIIFSFLFFQNVGQSSVLVAITGNVNGQVPGEGAHSKLPWEDPATYNTRNQRVVFVDPKTSTGDNAGGVSDGREIAVIDKDGVASNVDITVVYNLDPSKVIDIYKQYNTEDLLKSTLIYNDIRSVVRTEGGKFHTLQLLTDRSKYAAAIRADLDERWRSKGVLIDEVSLQQIDPPQSVKEAYAVAQKSQIEVQKATNDLNATKVSAQKQVVEAQAQADANNLLTLSLTPQVLQQKYIDALKAGTVYVVTPGSGAFVNAVK